MNPKIKLSVLWLIVVLNIITADVLSVFIELEKKDTLDILGEVKMIMAIAALILNIPILMIYFSRFLDGKVNRVLNIVAALVTLLFVIGGGSIMPHYIICASIEVALLILIIWNTWKWNSV